MALQGGADRKLIRPLERKENYRGTHMGSSEALNIRNAQPGFAYYYERARSGDVVRRLNQGWEMLTDKHQEQWGAQLPEDVQKQLDTARAFKDVVAFRLPIHKYREMKKEKLETAKRAREGVTQDYLDRGEGIRSALGSAAPENDLYYRRSHHDTRS